MNKNLHLTKFNNICQVKITEHNRFYASIIIILNYKKISKSKFETKYITAIIFLASKKLISDPTEPAKAAFFLYYSLALSGSPYIRKHTENFSATAIYECCNQQQAIIRNPQFGSNFEIWSRIKFRASGWFQQGQHWPLNVIYKLRGF